MSFGWVVALQCTVCTDCDLTGMLRMELLARRVLARGEALAPTFLHGHAGQRRGVLTIKKFTRPEVSRAQGRPAQGGVGCSC